MARCWKATLGCVIAGLSLEIGCAARSPLAPAPVPDGSADSHAAPVASSVGSAPSVSAGPGSPDASSASPAKVELRASASSVAAGGSIELTLVNVGERPFVFEHPGASNGCGAFRWALSARSKGGEGFVDRSLHGHGCTMAIVPPRRIEIAPGASVPITLDTSRGFYPDDAGASLTGDAKPLPPGEYVVTVSGAELALSTSLTITAAPPKSAQAAR